MVQEPNLTDNKVQPFSDNVKIFQSSELNNRAAIFVHKNFNGFLLNQFSNRDQCAILAKINNTQIIYVSVYMPGDSVQSPPNDILKNLVRYAKDKNIKLVGCADANAHNLTWGSTDTNQRGIDLLDFLLLENLIVCNTGSKPTFVVKNRKEVLDITFVNNQMINFIKDWNVSDIEALSDHKAIDFNVDFNPDVNSNNFRNVRKTNWGRFREVLDVNRENSGSIYDINQSAQALHNDIIDAFNKSCKQVKGRSKGLPSWWTPELTNLKREVARLKRRVDRHSTEARQEEYRISRNNLSYQVKKAKNVGWQRLCNDMTKLDTAAKIQKVMKTGSKQELGSLLKPDGSYTTSTQESLQVLLDTHFPGETNPENEASLNFDGNTSHLDIDKVVNVEAVRAALKSFKPFKAPGNDGIYPIMLQQGMDIIEHDIVDLYRRCLREGKVPDIWLDTRVVFIPKPGKKDNSSAKNRRPISLASYFSKGLERIISWHLNESVIRDKLDSNIYSYREGVGTEDAIHNLTTKIQKALDANLICCVVFFDMSSAFNTASVNGMINCLSEFNIEREILQLGEFMLKNRVVTAEANGFKKSKKVNRGCPQGGIKSTYYWNGLKQNLKKRLRARRSPTHTNVYADDDVNIAVAKYIDECIRQLQGDMATFEEWANDFGLSFNSDKTKIMMFTKRRFIIKPDIFLCGKKLDWVNSYKYLGVTISQNFGWKEHLINIAQRATFTMVSCRRMMSRTWGLSPRLSRWMYLSLVRPIMTYASMIWVKSTYIKSHMDIITKVQRRGCLSVLNAMSSTPTVGMEIMLGIQPLSIHIRIQSITTYKRLLANGNWLIQDGENLDKDSHVTIMRKITKNLETLHLPRDKLLHTAYTPTKFSTEILPREVINAVKKKPKPTEPNTINCFTDGSKFDGRDGISRSGFGYLIWGENIKQNGFNYLGTHATVYQCELMAIQEAAFVMINKGIVNKKILFYVDNQAAITTLGNYLIKSNVALKTKQMVNTLSHNNQVIISWIPGHNGHQGNVVADNLAKDGANLVQEGPKAIIPLAEAVITDEIKNLGVRMHRRFWDSHPHCRQTKMMLPTAKNKLWREIIKQPRKMVNLITQLYTGHATLKRHLNLMAIEDDGRCNQCNEENTEETVQHYLAECPAFSRSRRNSLGYISLTINELPKLKLTKVLKYVKDTKRFEQNEDE